MLIYIKPYEKTKMTTTFENYYNFSLEISFEFSEYCEGDDEKAEKTREEIMEMLWELHATEFPLGLVRDKPTYQIEPCFTNKLLLKIQDYSNTYNNPCMINLIIG